MQDHRANQDDASKQISYVINTTATAKASISVPDATFEAPDAGATTTGKMSDIKTGYTYYVYFEYSKTGYITRCTITRINS